MNKQFKGVSAYALLSKTFPIRRFIRCYPFPIYYPATAILFNRFGVSFGHIKTFCKAFPIKHALEAFFSSGPARRNHSFDMFDIYQDLSVSEYNRAIIAGTLPNIEKKIHKFAVALRDNITDKTKLLICPELEDNLSDHAFCILLNLFKSEFKLWKPQPTFVRSPCTGDKGLYGCYYERHGRNTKACDIYNPDGVSVDFDDGEAYFDTMSLNSLTWYMANNKAAKLRLIWSANMQGNGHASSFNYKPPTKRNFIVTDNAILYCQKILNTI
jgi:hypothetical protein